MAEFSDDVESADLMLDVLISETTSPTSVCLSLELGISSSMMIIDIIISVLSFPETLVSSTEYVTSGSSCHPRRLCFWKETISVDSGERLLITAGKARFTRGAVVFAFVANISLTPGNCSSPSSDSIDSKFS